MKTVMSISTRFKASDFRPTTQDRLTEHKTPTPVGQIQLLCSLILLLNVHDLLQSLTRFIHKVDDGILPGEVSGKQVIGDIGRYAKVRLSLEV